MDPENFDDPSVRIHIGSLDNEPFIIHFYHDTPIQDKEFIIHEALENILLGQQDPSYNVWDTNKGIPVNIDSKQLHTIETFLIAIKYEEEQKKDNIIVVEEENNMNGIIPAHKNQSIHNKVQNKRDDSVSRSLGPKADIAKRESSSSGALGFNYRNYKNKPKSPSTDQSQKIINNGIKNENLSNSQNIIILDPEKIELAQSVISNPNNAAESDQIEISIKKNGLIKVKEEYSPEKQSVGQKHSSSSSPQKIQAVISYGTIWTNLDNDIGVIPIDGDDPKIWTKKENFPVFTYLEKALNSKYNPKLPPPTYIPYTTLSKLRPSDKSFIFKGIEINSAGELVCVDKEILAKQKGIVTEVLGKLAKSIAEGRGVVGISLPVRIFEPRSMIERIIDWWSFMPTFLLPAAYEQDPLERLKNVVAFAVSGLYVSASQLKPFNPLLGETYQGFFPGYDINIYCEHTSHHPPITNFFVYHKEFKFYGRYEYYANLETNTLTLLQDGPNYCEFKNGEKVVFYWPFLRAHGMLFGDRTVKWVGVLKFIDEKNQLKAIIKMDDGEKKGVFSKSRSDVFNGQIYRYKDMDPSKSKKQSKREQHKEEEKMKDLDQSLSKISGSWLEQLDIDGKEFWNINKHFPTRPQPVKNPLPSDCRYREDLLWVKHNNLPYAEEWKLKLEERQRYERKLRQDNEKQKGKPKKH